MEFRRLKIEDVIEITPRRYEDSRGSFAELYRFDLLEAEAGYPLRLAQINQSVSPRGVVRGVHFAGLPESQAKYVTCVSGSVLDFVVEIRVGAPNFGNWDAVVLDDKKQQALYIPEGLGHCFVALSPTATVQYVCSTTYDPARERGINPFDEGLGLEFPLSAPELILSPKDRAAPTLMQAQHDGMLPNYDLCQEHYAAQKKAFSAGGNRSGPPQDSER